MKKMVLFALLLATAASAQAIVFGPHPNQSYQCWYWSYSGLAVNGGNSRFDVPGAGTLRRGIEYFDAFHPRFGNYTENQKVTFSNPVAIRDHFVVIGTRWQFTINPAGPQCTVEVYDDGDSLYFFNCSDGHSRDCYLNP